MARQKKVVQTQLTMPTQSLSDFEALQIKDSRVLKELEVWLQKSGLSSQEILDWGQDGRLENLLMRLAQCLDDRRRSRAALEAFPGHISWVTKDLTYLGVNEGLAESVGLKPSDFVGKPVGFINNQSPFLNFVKDFMLRDVQAERQLLEVYTPHINEFRWTSVVARKFDHGEAAVVIGLDVTELRHVQELVSNLQAKETLMMRLATLGEVAAGMTHEINNPLTVITTGTYALKEHLLSLNHLDKESQELLSMLEKATRHVTTIVETARHLSRGESKTGEVKNIFLHETITDALALCGEKIKKASVQIRLDVDRSFSMLLQPSSVLQILINLISNACDALEELKIPYKNRWIEISMKKSFDTLLTRVTDSGPGIPVAIRKTMFQPFFTTKAPGKGTGLGLSIVRSLVEQHGGKIWLDETSPHTSFVFELKEKKIGPPK